MVVRKMSKGDVSVDLAKLRKNIDNVNPLVNRTLANAVKEQPGKNDSIDTIDERKLTSLSNIISNNINAVTDLREITPYIDKAELIWRTLLLYPNGKQKNILTYGTHASDIKNSMMHTGLLDIWSNYFTLNYKIETELKKVIDDVLWNTGSYCWLNLSRPNLDYLINGATSVEGTESLKQSLSNEFVTLDKAKNLGLYVRDPNIKANDKVTGIEELFSNTHSDGGHEFNLFTGMESNGESLDSLLDFTITDNPSVLYIPKIKETMESRVSSKAVTGTESLEGLVGSILGTKSKAKPDDKVTQSGKLTAEQMEKIQEEIYQERETHPEPVKFIPNNDELTIDPYGTGVTWHVPSEACVRIHRNGDNSTGIDYILLLDDNGNFLKQTKDFEFYQNSSKTSNGGNTEVTGADDQRNTQGSTNHIITSLKRVQEGSDCDFDMSGFAKVAEDLIIKRFMASVIKGDSDNISVTIDEETNKIFLSRMFKQQKVRCLYVPGEAITYVALKYGRLGLGQSLVHNAKMQIARLAAMDLADALANIEGSQPHTQMVIGVEREDTNPYQTISQARSTYFKANPRLHSILASSQLSVPQVADALMQQSLTVKVDANENPHIVAPNIDLQQQPRENFKPVDDDSRQELLNRIVNYFCLPMSWVDISDDQNNFQIEALNEHQMVLNQTIDWQETLAGFISDFQRKHIKVNKVILTKLVNFIEENKTLWVNDSKESLPKELSEAGKVAMILGDFLNNVYCELPAPAGIASASKIKDTLEVVNDLVTSWEELSGSNKLIEGLLKTMGLEETEYNAEVIKESIKACFLTEAYRRFNVPMPFDNIVGEGKQGGMYGLINSMVAQRGNVEDFLQGFLTDAIKQDKKIIKNGTKIKEKYDSIHEDDEEEEDYNNPDDEGLEPGEDEDFDNEDDTSTEDESDNEEFEDEDFESEEEETEESDEEPGEEEESTDDEEELDEEPSEEETEETEEEESDESDDGELKDIL